jgi:hypothetical protein
MARWLSSPVVRPASAGQLRNSWRRGAQSWSSRLGALSDSNRRCLGCGSALDTALTVGLAYEAASVYAIGDAEQRIPGFR